MFWRLFLNNRYHLIFIFMSLSIECVAGGDYWYVSVVDTAIKNDYFEMRVNVGGNENIFECEDLKIIVDHEDVPGFPWSWFIDSDHPSLKETEEAIEFIKREAKWLYFGYIGGGLKRQENKKCTFRSKGLRVEKVEGKEVVFSFYEQV